MSEYVSINVNDTSINTDTPLIDTPPETCLNSPYKFLLATFLWVVVCSGGLAGVLYVVFRAEKHS